MTAPIACTLPGPQLRERLVAIAQLAKRSLLSHVQDGATLRLQYTPGVADELERLVALERECCAFLDFELVRTRDATHLAITAPADATEFAPVLLAHFLGNAPENSGGCTTGCGCGAASGS